MIMNGSDFPSGRKGIINKAVGVKKNKGKDQGKGIIWMAVAVGLFFIDFYFCYLVIY